jgi:alpha-mannosidase
MQIIAHTHWDREWFVTEEQTTHLLGRFYEKLFGLIERNTDYVFTLDGQTLMLEDFLHTLPQLERSEFVSRLHKHRKNLFAGPYYGQIDWRISEEAAFMNIYFGIKSARELTGTAASTGWLVDNFGFSSQVPQIHQLFGIDSLFLWRGFDPGEVPCTEAKWSSPDGSEVLMVYLLDSYRNLMRICENPETARIRLNNEIAKLRPYSLTELVPLLDGYDLDPDPEDPSVLHGVSTISPEKYVSSIRQDAYDSLRKVSGELLSGRVASTFPGTLSTRPYLKLMNWTCEYLLSRVAGPLMSIYSSVEAAELMEQSWKLVLQNLVHDSICGVGVDQVHEEMEARYERVLVCCRKIVEEVLKRAAKVLPHGLSYFNVNACRSELAFECCGSYLRASCEPGSIASLNPKRYRLSMVEEAAEELLWQNDHYSAAIEDGKIIMRRKGEILELFPRIVTDNGDEYSCELKETVDLSSISAKVIKRSEISSEVELIFTSSMADITMLVTFSDLPIVSIEFTVNGISQGYAVLLTLQKCGKLVTGMPFDRIERPEYMVLSDPSELLQPFLVAAREVGICNVFPMKDFVCRETDLSLAALMAGGIYSYTTERFSDSSREVPETSIIVSRSVTWLAKDNITGRIGDAGPAMYTPGAACKRRVSWPIGLYFGAPEGFTVHKSSFLHPPIVFHNRLDSRYTGLSIYKGAGVEVTSLYGLPGNEEVFLRVFNPSDSPATLEFQADWVEISPSGKEKGIFNGVLNAREIVTLKRSAILRRPSANAPLDDCVKLVYPEMGWSISEDRGIAEEKILNEMRASAEELETEARGAEEIAMHSDEREKYRALLDAYSKMRRALEFRLSVMQLTEKEGTQALNELFIELNSLRIKRRTTEFLLATLI